MIMSVGKYLPIQERLADGRAHCLNDSVSISEGSVFFTSSDIYKHWL